MRNASLHRMSTPFTFGVVGAGWRAEFFVRLARLLPDELTLVGASVRRSDAAEQLTRRWASPPSYLPQNWSKDSGRTS
jgi:hypothetical protein